MPTVALDGESYFDKDRVDWLAEVASGDHLNSAATAGPKHPAGQTRQPNTLRLCSRTRETARTRSGDCPQRVGMLNGRKGDRLTVKRGHFVWVGLAAVGTVIGAVLWISSTSAPKRGRRAETASGTPELVSSTDEASTEALEEVQRLRAALKQKDEQLRLLTAQPRVAENAPNQVVAEPPVPEVDPAAKAADLLDERMLMAPADPRKAAEMERALRDVADPTALGEAKLTFLHCGSTLCKVTLSADSPAAINQSMIAMNSHLPKLFGASTVLQLGNGQSAMYVAKSSEDLALGPANEGKP